MFIVADMPKDSYKNKKQAEKNAKIILKKTGCDAVKLRVMLKIIKF